MYQLPEIIQMAKMYDKTAVQIGVRWNLQHKVITVPRSVRKDRILSNADIFDFELSDDDMKLLVSLDRNQRFGAHPYHFDF